MLRLSERGALALDDPIGAHIDGALADLADAVPPQAVEGGRIGLAERQGARQRHEVGAAEVLLAQVDGHRPWRGPRQGRGQAIAAGLVSGLVFLGLQTLFGGAAKAAEIPPFWGVLAPLLLLGCFSLVRLHRLRT